MKEYSLNKLRQDIAPLREALAEHRVYSHIRSIEDLRVFMHNHVFAVWDFMSLLKALQRQLTCVSVPWTPSSNAVSCRLINEIVLGEESDLCDTLQYASHFELYKRAMQESDADTTAIDRFIALIRQDVPVSVALLESRAPEAAKRFVESTWRFLNSKKAHVIAAAFTFGREDVIPDMFRAFIKDLNRAFPGKIYLFEYYLERHIDVDEHTHAPMAIQMLEELCGNDQRRWQEASETVIEALTARLALWDGIAKEIELNRENVAVSFALR